MKAGDEIELIEEHPYKGERGLVARVDWRDSDRAYVVFHNWLKGEASQAHLRPGWWPTTALKIVGHTDHDVYTTFLEAFEQSSLQHIDVAEIYTYTLKKTGHIVLKFEVEALLAVLFPNQETSMVSRDDEEENP